MELDWMLVNWFSSGISKGKAVEFWGSLFLCPSLGPLELRAGSCLHDLPVWGLICRALLSEKHKPGNGALNAGFWVLNKGQRLMPAVCLLASHEFWSYCIPLRSARFSWSSSWQPLEMKSQQLGCSWLGTEQGQDELLPWWHLKPRSCFLPSLPPCSLLCLKGAATCQNRVLLERWKHPRGLERNTVSAFHWAVSGGDIGDLPPSHGTQTIVPLELRYPLTLGDPDVCTCQGSLSPSHSNNLVHSWGRWYLGMEQRKKKLTLWILNVIYNELNME